MMRHVTLDQPIGRALGDPARVIIGCLKKALLVHPAPLAHERHVLARVRIERQRQRGRIGRDYVALAVAAQSRLAQTERAILIIERAVEGIQPRFRHAPRPARRLLCRYDAQAALAQQRIRPQRQHQAGHEIFKYRAAPRNQRAALPHAGAGTPQPRKMLDGSLPQHDRRHAQQPRFGGQ